MKQPIPETTTLNWHIQRGLDRHGGKPAVNAPFAHSHKQLMSSFAAVSKVIFIYVLSRKIVRRV
jgi:hypothetical protein